MPENSRLNDIRKRLHKSLDRMTVNQFQDMTPAQLIQYEISHPEDEERVTDYILRFCSPERQQAIQEQAEQLESEIRYGDF